MRVQPADASATRRSASRPFVCNVEPAAGHLTDVSVDEEDFEQIFSSCYEQVRRFAARRVAPDAVQDVVADTFLIAWRRRKERKGDALPWLFGIARRVAATQQRSNTRRVALRERLHAEVTRATEGEADRSVDPQLELALLSLPERDREALVLVVWDELDHRTAASVMGCSTGALTVRLHRARRHLARLLSTTQAQAVEVREEARPAR
jgi:RNA polymerase sigma-70 factor (ECF subfamily)